VLRGAARRNAGAGANVLKPGGTLYVEIPRRVGRVSLAVAALWRTAVRAGFDEIETFWNCPTSRAAQDLPVADDCALTNSSSITGAARSPDDAQCDRFGFRRGVGRLVCAVSQPDCRRRQHEPRAGLLEPPPRRLKIDLYRVPERLTT
jgi:hypothetical protein